MVADHQAATFPTDLRVGGDYGTALCASVANGRNGIVRMLLKKNPDLKAIGRWIKDGWQIPLMAGRPIWFCASCCCDEG